MYKKLSIIMLALLAIPFSAQASSVVRPRVQPVYHQNTRVQSSISVDILDRTTNRKLDVYFYNGKNYIVGERNHEYQINLYNNARPYTGRKLAIVSVDGINVITGQTAGYQQSGYVVDANDNLQIKGWRKDMNAIAKFYFTYPENSYAGRTDRPDNTGVIGIAIFNEKYVPPPVVFNEESDTFNSSLGNTADSMRAKGGSMESSNRSAPAAAPAQKSELGTGHGGKERSSAVNTEFERASSTPNDTIALYYDTYEHLVELGIIPVNVQTSPSPFPNGNKFVPDPR